jgi:succinate dehydrogenase / fumarate reductase flavoprotein subunit
LYNSEGERFMERYDPVRMELSTRDRVALANYTEIHEGRGGPNGGVWLDVSHIDKATILERLPRMYRQFIEYQMLDISRSPMEVAPTAHYSMGGIVVDPATHATDVEGLFAAGEVTAGLHGANRLGGNSLAETIIFGRRAGEAAAKLSQERDVQLRSRAVIEAARDELDSFISPGAEFARPLQRALRDTMWEHCGVVRSASGLKAGLDRIDEIEGTLGDVDVRPSSEGYVDLAHVLDLRAAIVTARATVLGALERRETRGCHNRSDYEKLDDAFDVNIRCALTSEGDLSLADARVPEMPDELRRWATQAEELDVTGRLVE